MTKCLKRLLMVDSSGMMKGLCRTRGKGFSSTTHYLQDDCKERSAQFVELGSLSAHMYVVQ